MTIAALPMEPPAAGATSAPGALCAHCGLNVPAGLIEAGAARQFCCQGCRTVYLVIHSCSMDQYYRFLERDRAAGAAAAAPARVTGKAYREFDDPAFLDLHAPRDVRTGTRTLELYLEGVHCAACVWLVEKLPAVLPGIIESRLDLAKQLVRVTWPEGSMGGVNRVTASAIARTLDSLGYPPHPARSNSARAIRTRDDRRQLVRIGVAGACAGNTMLLGTALYAGLFATMDPAYTMFFRWLSMIIGVTALVWPGGVFFRGALAAIRTRTPHLDLPIALGLGAGGIVGAINTVLNRGEIYFDSLSVLVFLLLAGRFVQRRQQALADDAVELLFSLTPMSARRVEEPARRGEVGAEAVVDVPIASLQTGDVVEVRPGESMPVDGVLLGWGGGGTTIDESLLTGESLPRRLEAGAAVHAGTTNLSSPVRLRVEATGEATRVGRLMKLVAECARRKAPMVLFADRIAGRFLVAVLCVAALVFAAWWLLGSRLAIDHAVAILIVACPCALGLATPLAVTIAIGRAARRGILIKGGETLERLARPGVLLLDKTGTLTTGRMSVQTWEGPEEVKAAVAAIEAHATHPVARALASLVQARAGACGISQNMRGGISGDVDTHHYVIGSLRFIREHEIWPSNDWCTRIVQVTAAGLSPVVICRDGRVVALAGVGDSVRPDALESLERLRKGGWELEILSGDHPEVVGRVAREVGIDEAVAQGGLLPEQKLAVVQARMTDRAASAGPVVMVGDGVNDAAALAAASVGIAVHCGAEASLAAASVYLNQPGLAGIVQLMHAARKTVSVIRRSLVASLAYNTFAISLAAAGLINPLVAAILMPISSLTVLSLAFGVRTFDLRRQGGAA